MVQIIILYYSTNSMATLLHAILLISLIYSKDYTNMDIINIIYIYSY